MDPFGKKRLPDFYLDPTYININHGSYGTCPKSVMTIKRQLEQRCDFNTEKWFRGQAEIQINQIRQYVARKINCKTANVFLVQNATDAFNCIMKSLTWSVGDVVLLPNTAYASIRKTLSVLRQRYGITIVQLPFTTEDLQTPQSIQLRVQDFVNSYQKKFKLAVFDHIISVPAIVCPVQELQLFFSQKRIPFVVDGAHAIGQLEINMMELNPKAYFSNFHKWAFAPKNAAFLYLDDEYLDIVRPVITGNFKGEGPERQFFWTGTRDLTSYLCIKAGYQYHESFGINAVNSYNHSLCLRAGQRMVQIWQTKLLSDDVRVIGNMNNVEVPCEDITLCVKIANLMMKEVNCYPIFYHFDGKNYCRISAQIFNEIGDYQFAAEKFLEYLSKERNTMSNK